MSLADRPLVYRGMLKITDYKLLGELPDPFLSESGKRIRDPSEWDTRRSEIYRTAVELQYGTMPPEPEFLEVEKLYDGGRENSYLIRTGTRENPVSFRLKLILPPEACGLSPQKVPVIVDGDLCFGYVTRADWIETALESGVAWALFDRTELAHDVKNEKREEAGALYRTYPGYTFGALGAWAWGYSRVTDALEIIGKTDMNCVVFSGHSRGGKTAALAGALDTRAAIVNPNETCAGACSCYRVHIAGSYEGAEPKRSETLADLYRNFPFWIGPGMAEYTQRENELPFDCHFLKAMIAPRTLFVSEAAGDLWANPVGSYITTTAAREVYKFLGAEEELFWYFRPGKHAHNVEDVEMLLKLIERRVTGEFKAGSRFFNLPFEFPDEELGRAFTWRAPLI